MTHTDQSNTQRAGHWFVFARDGNAMKGMWQFAEIVGPILATSAEDAIEKFVRSSGQVGTYYAIELQPHIATVRLADDA